MSWLEEAFQHLTSVFPRIQQVQINEGGIKFKKGKAESLEPGLCIYWPLTSDTNVINVSRQVLSIGPVNSECGDRTLIAAAIVVYRIVDVHKHIVENEDAELAIDEVCQSLLLDATRGFYDSTSPDWELVNARLTDDARCELGPFGVDVEYMRLQSVSRGMVLIHSGIEMGGA